MATAPDISGTQGKQFVDRVDTLLGTETNKNKRRRLHAAKRIALRGCLKELDYSPESIENLVG